MQVRGVKLVLCVIHGNNKTIHKVNNEPVYRYSTYGLSLRPEAALCPHTLLRSTELPVTTAL